MSIFERVDEYFFTDRPIAIPYNYRTSYKISQLCLILHFLFKSKGATLERIQLISAALMTTKANNELISYLENENKFHLIIRFDPTVNVAIKYAIAEGLIKHQKNKTFKLNSKGIKLVQKILTDSELLTREKMGLQNISKYYNEIIIENLLDSWGKKYV